MTTLADVVYALRVRLHQRDTALRAIGQQFSTSRVVLPDWWAPLASAECLWVHGDLPNNNSDVQRPDIRFLAGAEALALLGALARVDKTQFLRHARRLWPRSKRELLAWNTADAPVVGYSRIINTSAEYEGISERVVGVQRPTAKLLRDVQWFEAALPSAVDQWRPIPVQLYVRVSTSNELVVVLRKILRDVMTQQSMRQSTAASLHELGARATMMTRFYIVEVLLERQCTAVMVSIESLECLARMAQVGIRIGRLPPTHDVTMSTRDLLSTTESLRTLFPTSRDSPSACIDNVFVNQNMPRLMIPGLFSALQVNKTVKNVDLEVERHPFGAAVDESLENARMIWQWAAYALFSPSADHNLEKVTIDLEDFDYFGVEAMSEILHAKTPFAVPFAADCGERNWISASRVQLANPRDSQHEETVYVPQAPVSVRVIDRLSDEVRQWWRVLLPGCGEAWVAMSDAAELPTDEDSASFPTDSRPFDFHCVRFEEIKKDVLLRFLRLVPHLVNSIEMETSDAIQDGIDVTDWTIGMLRLLPKIQRLDYAWTLEINRLLIFAETAEVSVCRLRYLSLQQIFSVDSTDLVEFLDVLCDATHPLTKHLEELHLIVSMSADSSKRLIATWSRLLKSNRTLHTIHLAFDTGDPVEGDIEDVAIRTGPLCTIGKLAFLSAIQNPSSTASARSRLDTGVLGTIFGFAAPHRIRKIKITP